MVRLLRLMVDYGLETVLQAIETASNHQQYTVDLVAFNLNRAQEIYHLPMSGPTVQAVDMTAYDQLLLGVPGHDSPARIGKALCQTTQAAHIDSGAGFNSPG